MSGKKKRVAVLQSNYLPWKGYFDIINDVDEFIFYDEVQYTKNDWRNRNLVYSLQGLSWISLPCKFDLSKKISEVTLRNELAWGKKHWDIIVNAYQKAPFFQYYESFLRHIYFKSQWEYLSDLNQYIIKTISRDYLNITTEFTDSTKYPSSGDRNERLLGLLKKAEAGVYISGPSAKNYMTVEDYEKAGIEIEWKDYSGYPEYTQRKQPFENNVSILDMLVHLGEETPYYIWGWRTG